MFDDEFVGTAKACSTDDLHDHTNGAGGR
ncbi:MAG: hypothetical protein XE11_2338, partial [Methanomicrobiales archaeon 53_19]